MMKYEYQHYRDMEHDFNEFVTKPRKERCGDILLDHRGVVDTIGDQNKEEKK